MVLLFDVWLQRVPPLSEDLGNCTVVVIGMPLMDQGSMAFAEDHEGVHWPPNATLNLHTNDKKFSLKRNSRPAYTEEKLH